MPIRRPKNTSSKPTATAIEEPTKARPVRRKRNAVSVGNKTAPPASTLSTAEQQPKKAPRKTEAPNGNAAGLSLRKILSDPWLRFTHLYFTKDKFGYKVPFTPWPEQEELYWQMHYLNVILKARQRGVTTAIQIFMLDRCLFNENINAGVIAHNREDSQKFFEDKIKFAYDNLPDQLKASIPARNDNTNELAFANGSSIRVGTSMRSGTLQYLHISEYGKICAKMPDKATEIKTGSLNTVAPGNFVFIESTAEGAHGHFYETCKTAENAFLSGLDLTPLDYRFFFFPWWRAPEYQLHNVKVNYEREDLEYFAELEEEQGIVLTEPQRAWYVKKKQEQGDMAMTQEYPSTPEEAFRGIVEGAIYGKQMRLIRKQRRIREIPHLPHVPVNTFWDIGRDTTAIWFHQRVGEQNRFIDYHAEPNHQIGHFARLLLQDQNERFHKYTYGVHYFPHDMGEIDYSSVGESENKTRKEVAESLGLKPVRIVSRVLVLEDGIEMTRQALASCYFDEKNCDEGIKCLENYRYEYDEKLETYRKVPLHNWASHGADAIRQFAQGYKVGRYSQRTPADDNPLSRERRRRARDQQADWRV